MADPSAYPVIIRWSDEDQVFVGRALDLPGCMAHGDTREEAEASLRDAIGFWIEVAEEFRDSVPEPHSATTEWFNRSRP
jgi:predicted RNase H-like HicB family nuclease